MSELSRQNNSNESQSIQQMLVGINNMLNLLPKSGGPSTSASTNTASPCEKLQNDLRYIRFSLEKLNRHEGEIDKSIKDLVRDIEDIFRNGSSSSTEQEEKLSTLGRNIVKLKIKIPAPHTIASIRSRDSHTNYKHFNIAGTGGPPDLDQGAQQEFLEAYGSLDDRSKICLLCFALFPEGAEVKKRLLIYWWVGEGLVESSEMETAEEIGEKIIKNLVGKKLGGRGFIEPVKKMGGLIWNSFKMPPLVRSAVIRRAKEVGFFDFDNDWHLTANSSSCFKACLLENKEVLAHEQLRTIFNFNKRFPDYKFVEFSKMKNLNVLYLGRWLSVGKQNTTKHHIEIESTDFLNGLKYMKFLRFISLQGMSRISELPETICGLPNLRILDLRACHNLEVLPDEISLLKKMTHLDLSECYLLDYMPQGLSLLTGLQVLKGFVIGNAKTKKVSCTLEDLQGLKKLRKLSISTSIYKFPREGELKALQKFEALQKLKIAWGGDSFSAVANNKQSGNEATQKQETRTKGTSAPTGNKRDKAKEETGTNQTAAPTSKSQDKAKEESGAKSVAVTGAKSPSKAKEDIGAKNAVAASSKAPGKVEEESGAASTAAESPDKAKVASGTKQIALVSPKSPQNAEEEGGVKKADASCSKTPDRAKQDTGVKLKNTPSFKGLDKAKETGAKLKRGLTLKKPDSGTDDWKFSMRLEKLDLECFPQEASPDWLKPGNLQKLNKLYIRGGKLKSLGEIDKWEVEILRLKYLTDFKLTWRELEASFPKLICMEKVKCPKLAFYPCDENGFWMKD